MIFISVPDNDVSNSVVHCHIFVQMLNRCSAQTI